MTTRIPCIRWPGAVRRCATLQSSSSKDADRLVVGQSRLLTLSISVAVTKPLHFQSSDVQHRRFCASPSLNNSTKILLDDLVVIRSFSSSAADAATSNRDETNQVCIRYALVAAIHFSFIYLIIAKISLSSPHTANYFTR